MTSLAAALLGFTSSIYEHHTGKLVHSFVLLILAVILFVVGAYIAYAKIREENEFLKSAKPDIAIEIRKVFVSPGERSNPKLSPIFHGAYNIFLFVELVLKEPHSVDVSRYVVNLRRPDTYAMSFSSVGDLAEWVWTDLDSVQSHAVDLEPISTRLESRGKTVNGWLHFRTCEMEESNLYVSVLTLGVEAVHGHNEKAFQVNLPNREKGRVVRRRLFAQSS